MSAFICSNKWKPGRAREPNTGPCKELRVSMLGLECRLAYSESRWLATVGGLFPSMPRLGALGPSYADIRSTRKSFCKTPGDTKKTTRRQERKPTKTTRRFCFCRSSSWCGRPIYPAKLLLLGFDAENTELLAVIEARIWYSCRPWMGSSE